jgi:hypothetical protein
LDFASGQTSLLKFGMPKTMHQVIVYHAGGLHEGVADGGSDKIEPPLF